MNSPKRHLVKIAGVIIVVCILAGYYSRKIAVEMALVVMDPALKEWSFVSCKPSLVYFQNGQFTGKLESVGWKISFEHKSELTNRVLIYYSFTGNKIGSMPKDLENRIKKLY